MQALGASLLRKGKHGPVRGEREFISVIIAPLGRGKPRSFVVSRVTTIVLFISSVGLLVFSAVSVLGVSGIVAALVDARSENDELREQAEGLRNAVDRLSVSAREFEGTLSSVMRITGAGKQLPAAPELGGLPLSVSPGSGNMGESASIARLVSFLDSSLEPLERIGRMMDNQGRVMNEIPNIWPISGGIGHISMYFGQNEHPLSGQWYIHNGIDISTFRQGDQVLATADGKVVQTGYDSGLGYFVTLQHAHGFFTRYGHLLGIGVQRGQRVEQGQTVGRVGNTGKSTGPHLHYEVHLGTSVIDPLKFLNVRSSKPAPSPAVPVRSEPGRSRP